MGKVYSMVIKYLDSKRISTSRASISKSDCLAYYNFEQTGSTLTNQATSANGYSEGVGSNADGTNTGVGGYTGATTGATGKVNNCWDFGRGSNTAGDYVSGINLNLNGASSISVWINIVLADYGEIIGRANSTNLVSYADGHIYYQGVATSAGVLSSNTWHHVVATTDSSNNCKIYVDNVLVKTGTGDVVSDSTVEYYIGARATSQNYHPDGKIDELSIWSRELTTSDISMLYNSGDGSTIDNTSGEQTKPTNVQDNSILVEKDTGRRYWFDEGALIYEDDFTSYANTTEGDTAYPTTNTTDMRVNPTVDLDFNSKGASGSEHIYYATDLNASDDKWVLRFKQTTSAKTLCASTGNLFTSFGLSSTTTAPTNAHDFIGVMAYLTNTAGNWYTSYSDGGTANGLNTALGGEDPEVLQTRYVQITRISTISFNVTMWTGGFDQTEIHNTTQAIPATVSGLKYLHFDSDIRNGNSGEFIMQIDDVEFYNGVTTPTPATWTMTPTHETLDSTNGSTDWDITNGGSDITKPIGHTVKITGSGAKSGYYDLGANVSTSKWVLRFKWQPSGTATSDPIAWVAVANVDTIISNSTVRDAIAFMAYSTFNYKISEGYNSRMDQSNTQLDTSPVVTNDNTLRYVELKRDGSNATLTFYDSDTYTTSIGTITTTIRGSGYRYIVAVTYVQGSGKSAVLSDVKFYNGVTSV